MPRAAILLVAVLAGFFARTGFCATGGSPAYSAATIVNAASNEPGAAAPNTFLTIYGSNLSYVTKSISANDIRGDILPTILPNTGVTVWVNRVRAHIYYVSPTQINVLVPSDTFPGPAEISVARDGDYGPSITLNITAAAPALFQMDASTAIAVHADGSLLTAEAPGRPGEDIVLYATGLGNTTPAPAYGQIPMTAARIKDIAHFRVILDETAVDPARVAYAGVSPGFAGLYQINVKLPADVGRNPQVRLQAGDIVSKAGVSLPVEATP